MALSSCALVCVCLCVKPGLYVILCQLSGEVQHGSLMLIEELNLNVVQCNSPLVNDLKRGHIYSWGTFEYVGK